MIHAYDSHPEIGLEIARGALSPRLARRFEDDCIAYASRRPKINAKATAEGAVLVHEIKSEHFITPRMPAISFILRKLGITPKHKVFVGFQPAYAFQDFHQDEGVGAPVVVVHASDDGVFDFVNEGVTPSKREFDYNRIPVDAGDIVAQFHPIHYHRGGNPSPHERYNLIIGQPKP